SALALLTLVSLLLVSNLIGGKKTVGSSALPLTLSKQTAKSATSAPQTASTLNQAEKQSQSQLSSAQEQLNKISEAVSANDWDTARSLFGSFNYKEHRLPRPQLHHPDISPFWQDFFDLYTVNLEQALDEENSRQARLAINQLFGIIGEQQARFGVRGLPIEIHRLRFLVREIELWNEVGNEQMMRVRLKALNDAWKEASSLIRARRNSDAVIKELETIMAKLLSPQPEQRLSDLTTALSKELDQAETLFHHQPRANSATSVTDRNADE
ncbi:MAG TPA: hypothetical protein VEF04_21445, partial [Blastocatellia bacterium]|nr:hypothetical protein [Blastocatellia bacterium]